MAWSFLFCFDQGSKGEYGGVGLGNLREGMMPVGGMLGGIVQGKSFAIFFFFFFDLGRTKGGFELVKTERKKNTPIPWGRLKI